jgi:hypothetical protein
VNLVSIDGSVKTVSEGWEAEEGLAWSPDGKEILFGASTGNTPLARYAATPAGKVRLIFAQASEARLMDVSHDARILFTKTDYRSAVWASRAGDTSERNLSFLNFSSNPVISADGKTAIFEEDSEVEGSLYAVCMRKTDGSPVVKLGPGWARSLSRDGRCALALVFTSPPHMMLLPTGVDSPRPWSAANWKVTRTGKCSPIANGCCWPPTSRATETVSTCRTSRAGRHVRSQEENVVAYNHSTSPDGKMYLARNGTGERKLFFVDGSPPRPILRIRELGFTVGWSQDGRHIYVYPASANQRCTRRCDHSA